MGIQSRWLESVRARRLVTALCAAVVGEEVALVLDRRCGLRRANSVIRARVPQHVEIVNDGRRKHAAEPCGLGGIEALHGRGWGGEQAPAERS